MTPSPELIHELRTARPVAPPALRARVRETARAQPSPSLWARLHFPARRVAVVAVSAAVALALGSAGVLGLAKSDRGAETLREQTQLADTSRPEATPTTSSGAAKDSAIGPNPDRASRVSATLTVEVSDPDAVSRAAQDALDLTRRLGGHVVSASVSTGEQGNAALTVRVPVARVQEAIVQLSALGRIVSQQVTIDDLQESLDALERRQSSVRGQIARITARLETATLDAETRAVLEARVQNLRTELRQLRRGIASMNAEARMSTIQLSVVTEGSLGVAPVPSRFDRTLDEALNVLAWEGVIVLGLLIVAAPFAIVALAAWLGRRFYRRREDERLLAS
jgi:Domain of unknown function (DUF4349)